LDSYIHFNFIYDYNKIQSGSLMPQKDEVNNMRSIPLLGSDIRLIYRCLMCSEPVIFDTKMLNFLINKKLKKPKECPSCGYKNRFEPVYEESTLIYFQDPRSLRLPSQSSLSPDPTGPQYQVQMVLQVMSEMERVSGTVKDDDLFDALMWDHGISKAESVRLIGELMREGTIHSPKPGYYKRTS